MSNNISNKKIVNGLSWSFAEKIMTDVMEALISIILARLLLPSDYGMVSLVQIFITITSIFVNCGLSTALIQRKNATEEQISTVFYLNFVIGLFLYFVLFVSAPFLATIKGNTSELTIIIRVLAIKIPVASIYSIQHAYVKKKMEFKLFFYSSLIGTLAAGVGGIAMALRGYGVWALIISTLIDQVLDCLVLFLTTKWFPRPCLKLRETWPIIDFGLKVLVTEFINRAYNQLRSLVQGIKYTTADLAFEIKGKKIPNMIINTIDPSISRVLTPVLSERQDDKESLKRVVRKSLQYYSFFVCPVMAGIALTANDFVPIIFTENWAMCVPFIQAYCFKEIICSITIYDEKIMHACGAGNDLIRVNSTRVAIDIIFICITILLFDNPISIPLSAVASGFVASFFSIRTTKKLANYGAFDHLMDYSPAFLMTVIMTCICLFGGMLFDNHYISLLAKIVSGVISYTILALAIKSPVANDLLSLMRKK